MAEAGATNHQIMALLGHSQARTSEVYTKGAERMRLAGEAAVKLRRMEW